LALVDSLDFRDANGTPFYEPTTELSLINHLDQGGFAVVLVPTNEHDCYRWHIFAYNTATKKVQLTSLRASKEGLFAVKDQTVLEPKPGEPETLMPRNIPGIIQRRFDLDGFKVAPGLTATQYDLQVERETQAGLQLLKESTRLMLVMGTEAGKVAALSFSIASDGTLAQINEKPEQINILRNDAREILLPLNTLDEIKAIAESDPSPQGMITGMMRTEGDAVQIRSPQAQQLQVGDWVKIAGTSHYDGHYIAHKVDENTFEIAAELSGDSRFKSKKTLC